MNRKIGFLVYGILVFALVIWLKFLMPDIPNGIFKSIFFGYYSRPFLIAIACVMVFAFEYISIVIPRDELVSSELFVQVRRPLSKNLFLSYIRFIIPYLIPFVVFRVYALIIDFTLPALLFSIVLLMVWIVSVFTFLGKNKAITNIVIISILICLRIIGTVII